MAQSHNVTGLVGRILADLPTDHRPPKALAVAFRQGMGQTLMAYEKRMVAVQVMEQTLTDAHIPYLTVKGTCTAAAYPDPSLRTCGDTDIVLTPEHQREAVQTLEQRGFAKKVTHDDVVMLTLHGFEFELHTRLESINDGSRALLANPFAPEVAYNKSKNIWVLATGICRLLHRAAPASPHQNRRCRRAYALLDTDLLLRKDPTLAPQVLELAERSGLSVLLVVSLPCVSSGWIHPALFGAGIGYGHGREVRRRDFRRRRVRSRQRQHRCRIPGPPKGRRWQQNALYPFGRIVSLLLPKSGLYGLPVPLFDPAALSASLCIPTPILSRSVSQSNPLRGGIASHCRQKSRCFALLCTRCGRSWIYNVTICIALLDSSYIMPIYISSKSW